MKKLIISTLLSVISLSLVACGNSSNQEELAEPTTEVTTEVDKVNNERPQGNGRNGGGLSSIKNNDPEFQAILTEVVDKFQLLSYTNSETGKTLDYYLFLPDNYDENEKYPLVMFIPDSSVVGKQNEYFLTQGYGGVIWATEEAQAKNPSLVMVPIFKEVAVNDNFEVTDEPDLAIEVINSLVENYSVDENRIYTTGQSMGCMTSFHLNLKYPDLFAASLFVGGQWNTDIMLPLQDKKFFYIVSAGDPKASKGQAELMNLFDENNIDYAKMELDAQLPKEEQNSEIENLLKAEKNINFVTFTLGSTIPEGMETGNAGEHMTSFDYAYKIDAVREWLFAQSK